MIGPLPVLGTSEYPVPLNPIIRVGYVSEGALEKLTPENNVLHMAELHILDENCNNNFSAAKLLDQNRLVLVIFKPATEEEPYIRYISHIAFNKAAYEHLNVSEIKPVWQVIRELPESSIDNPLVEVKAFEDITQPDSLIAPVKVYTIAENTYNVAIRKMRENISGADQRRHELEQLKAQVSAAAAAALPPKSNTVNSASAPNTSNNAKSPNNPISSTSTPLPRREAVVITPKEENKGGWLKNIFGKK